jgi:hypothetical protein
MVAMTDLELDDAARRIVYQTRESDVSIEEVLARIALESMGPAPLFDAREAGAELGTIGTHGYRLRERVDTALTGIEDII